MYNYPQVFIDWPHPVWSMHQIYWFGAILGAFVQYCSGCPCKPTLFLFGFDTFSLRKRTNMNWFSLVKRILMFYGRGRAVGFLSPVETNPQSMKSSYCTTPSSLFLALFLFLFFTIYCWCVFLALHLLATNEGVLNLGFSCLRDCTQSMCAFVQVNARSNCSARHWFYPFHCIIYRIFSSGGCKWFSSYSWIAFLSDLNLKGFAFAMKYRICSLIGRICPRDQAFKV